MKKFLILLSLLLPIDPVLAADNFTATAGAGLTFAAKDDGSGVLYSRFIGCDNTTVSQCWAVDASGRITINLAASSTVAVTQATASSLNATIVGTGTFAVQAAQSGTWNINNVSGTVSLPTGASTSALQPTNAAIGSTTFGQTGTLHLGAVTTSAPTYTTAQSNPLSLTTAGALRVDGSAVTQPVSLTSTTITGSVAVTQSGAWSLSANQSVNVAQINGVTPLMGNGGTGTGSQRVTVASDNTAFSVNPLSATAPVVTMNSASANSGLNSALAGVFDDVAPTAITENNFGFLRMSTNRNLYGTIRDAAGNERGVNVAAASTNTAATDTALVADPRPNSAVTVSGSTTNPSSTLTLTSTTTAYTAGQFIANNATAGSVTNSSFAIVNSAGGAAISRLRLSTNDTTSTAWGGQTIQVDIWSATPTWTNGDRATWSPATGAASHLGAFTCVMSAEFGDGAFAECAPVVGNYVSVKLASGTSIFWSLKSLTGSGVTGASKVFTVIAELAN